MYIYTGFCPACPPGRWGSRESSANLPSGEGRHVRRIARAIKRRGAKEGTSGEWRETRLRWVD